MLTMIFAVILNSNTELTDWL